MSDDRLIRLENLKAMNLGPTDLSRRFGRSISYWSDMLNNRKSFGEDVARDLEDKAGLPRYWMDTPHKGVEARETAHAPYRAEKTGAAKLAHSLLAFMSELDPLVAPSAKDVILKMLDGELKESQAVEALTRLQAMSAAAAPSKRTGTG